MSRFANRRDVDGILSCSRESMPEECKQIAVADLRKTLTEYFAINGDVALEVKQTKEGFIVRIDFVADRVKICNPIR